MDLKYQCGSPVKVGDVVVAGGDEFTVDRIDYEREILKGDIDPCGYAVHACTLVRRG